MAVNISPLPKFQFNQNGIPAAGAKLFTYAAGTTNKLATYTDSTGGTPNTNPILLDANGQCDMWLSTGSKYKLVLSPSNDTDPPTNAYWTEDQIGGVNDNSTILSQFSASSGSSLIGFLQAGTTAVARTLQDKDRDIVSIKDFGAVGDNATDDGAAIQTALTASAIFVPTATYKNTTTAVSLAFGKVLSFAPGASFNNSGSGSFTNNGVKINYGNNPSGWSSWTNSVANNFEGIAVDLGGYGNRTFGGFNTPTGIAGAINIPSTSTIPNHGSGISGWAKGASTTTGAVAIFGQSDVAATNALAWGINTRTIDNGFSSTVWGYECDINLTNVGSTAIGVEAVGGSTVEPATSTTAFRCNALGVFASPKNRWRYGFKTEDGAAINGLDIGSSAETASTGSQPINMYYRNASNVRTSVLTAISDGSGNLSFTGGDTGALFTLGTKSNTVIKMLNNQIGFLGASPASATATWGTPTGNAIIGNYSAVAASLAQTNSVVAQIIIDLKKFGLYTA